MFYFIDLWYKTFKYMYGQESVTLIRWKRPLDMNWTCYGEERDMCPMSILLNLKIWSTICTIILFERVRENLCYKNLDTTSTSKRSDIRINWRLVDKWDFGQLDIDYSTVAVSGPSDLKWPKNLPLWAVIRNGR